MALLVVFTARVIFQTAFFSVMELGDDKTSAITADLENYLENAKCVLWVAADTVDHMVENGATNEEIVEYITRESTNTASQFDETYTGIYGVIRGEYVDGVGWTPPDDYDFTKRDWYIITCSGEGEPILIPPYVDAQTGNVIISIGKALTDNSNALAMDLTLQNVQDTVEDIQINGHGYGYIIDNNGMIISHPDKSKNGEYINETEEDKAFYDKIISTGKGNFVTDIDGEKCTVFVDEVLDQWHLVIVTKNTELYEAPIKLLYLSVLINLVVFILISTFYILGYRYELKVSKRVEEMKEIEQRKDYEAKILKLEKSAADSANKAKSDFLADMSHEIRTPINAILGMNEMILHESKDEKTLDYASSIKEAGRTLLSIINTILDFSKIEDGRMHLVPVKFETVSLVNRLYDSIHERAKAKNLELTFDIDESIPSVLKGDDVRISQVIMNLLTNAVKYTNEGSVLYTMKNLGIEGDKVKLLVSVKDTGIGIREEDTAKLAVSFERLDEKKNRNIEGTGLGISIVTKLLRMMDSELQVKSKYGVGSEFFFEIPIEVVSSEPMGAYDENKREPVKKSETNITFTAPNAKVLLTDDNEMNRKVAGNLFKLFGIEPVICSSGKETIEQMRENKYDILFLDHMMPEMDGIETLKCLKEEELVDDIKVVALTANAVVGAKETYLEAGFDDYLSKPMNLGELEKLLIKYLPKDEETKETPAEEKLEDDETEIFEFAPIGPDELDSETEASSDASGVTDKLEGLGLSVKDGMMYCGEDEGFYVEMLSDYVKAAPENMEKLTGFLQDENMKDYKILVHAVKSSSKTIGAMDMFEHARDLENASAEENIDFVRDNHPALMDEYEELVKKIAEVIN